MILQSCDKNATPRIIFFVTLLEMPSKKRVVPPGSLADKIRMGREYHRPPLNRDQLAARIQKGSSTVGMYENGDRVPPEEVLSRIADSLNIPIEWFRDGKPTFPPDSQPIIEKPPTMANVEIVAKENDEPLISLVPYWGTVPCGDWQRPDAEDWEMIQVSDRVQTLAPGLKGIVAVRVVGNSLEPRFRHGQLISIKLSKEKQDGTIALARNGDGEFTLKLLTMTPDDWILASINPAYPSAKADTWEILGYAIYSEEGDALGLRAS